MAFRLPADQDAQARIFDLAIQSKQDQEENVAGGLGFEASSPVKRASDRFQGDTTGGSLGAYGSFGRQVNDVANQPAQRFAGDFMDRYLNGIFGPGAEMA